jgi:hypothetical protein
VDLQVGHEGDVQHKLVVHITLYPVLLAF